jgi:hypothetical protein
MKKTLLVLLGFISASAFSQTADEVIQKYSAAMGGLDAFKKVNTAKITGTLTSTTAGKTSVLPLTTQLINDKYVRTDVQVNGQTVTSVYNNGSGWKINPFDGAPTPTTASPAELINYKLQSSLVNNLMDYKSRGHQVELLGEEDIAGVKAHKIKLTSKDDGKVTTYFINTTDHLLVKSVAKRNVAGLEVDAETFYTDFKEIDGLKFCMYYFQQIQGKTFQQVKYDKVELNVPVDEKIFVMPK